MKIFSNFHRAYKLLSLRLDRKKAGRKAAHYLEQSIQWADRAKSLTREIDKLSFPESRMIRYAKRDDGYGGTFSVIY